MTYRIRALLEDPGQRLWGIRLTLIDEAGSPIGAILPADANGDLCQQDGRTYLRQSGAGRRPGVLDGPVDWLFDWTSPAAGNGTATLYAVGFAGNLDGSEQGDFTYTTASTIVEEAATGPEVTLVLQPDTPIVQAGTTLTIHAHVRNHTDRPQTVFVGSRAILPSGRARPQTGSILPLVRLDLAPFEQQDTTLVHPIPASAPAVTVEYRGFVGVPPASLLDRDGFMLAVLPPGS
jgi:hypothetical protein